MKDDFLFTVHTEIVMGILNEFETGEIPINLFDEPQLVKAQIKQRIIENFFWLITVYQQFGDNIRHLLPGKFRKTSTKKIKPHHVFSEAELDELASDCFDELIEEYSAEIKQCLLEHNKNVEEEIVIRAKNTESGFQILSVKTIGKIVDASEIAESVAD